ncbi:hypothetical protein VAR608DRAFT_2483 [Variovorax sp. HW608]|nr:hypothetical protein VAR608DRAFT_2483 [Variovorax sp. HW608]
MAKKSDRTGAHSPGVSIPAGGEAQGAHRRRKPRATKKKSSKLLRKASSTALRAVDDFNNLRQAKRAFDCIEDLLIPHNPHAIEMIYFEPGDLRPLVTAANEEVRRHMAKLRKAVEGVHELLLATREDSLVRSGLIEQA